MRPRGCGPAAAPRASNTHTQRVFDGRRVGMLGHQERILARGFWSGFRPIAVVTGFAPLFGGPYCVDWGQVGRRAASGGMGGPPSGFRWTRPWFSKPCAQLRRALLASVRRPNDAAAGAGGRWQVAGGQRCGSGAGSVTVEVTVTVLCADGVHRVCPGGIGY